ncbi:gamma-glutamyltransferase [Aciduricibacillus chroicocephali]|uniref:Glutathione hydrolase proenzyme n=1 Tax=Aciduricibacillus chroicocephali TaxID=3054939 RepID=A0ABY9KZQ0_9BACI|nr:gamma-glutamyltransferase [Bacillaceae bacterium 44XB]
MATEQTGSRRRNKPEDPRYGSPFTARKAAVASPNGMASMAGYNVLRKGGNAIDAMVAVNAALGVVFPHMTGAGGDAFWLVYDAKTKKRYALNASGHSAANVSVDDYKGQDSIDSRGARAAITVPGAIDGWCQANKRFGKISLKECLEPAIELANKGFPVSRSLAKFSENRLNLLRQYETTAETFLKDGIAPYMENEFMKNEKLGKTLEDIANGGRDAFYKGPIADKICEFLKSQGGFLDKKDFESHESNWVDPVEVEYRGRTVIAPPPNSDGMATLQILGMLENFDPSDWSDNQASFIDIFTRATDFAFQDRNHYLDDPKFNTVPTDELLSKEYLAQRAKRIADKTVGAPEVGMAKKGDTTFSCAVDEEGNAVAVIQSLYWEWGSGLVAGDTGLLLQNRGAYFSLNPESRDELKPNKRPAHTLTCSMVFKDDKPELIVGAMGGDGEPQTQATIISRVVDQGYNVQLAMDEPRWLLGRSWGSPYKGLRLEGRYSEELVQELENLGHINVSLVENYSDLCGHAQAIQIFDDRLEAAADPRAGGLAIGY